MVGGDPGTGKAWDVDHVTGAPTNTSISNATRTVENRASGSSNSVGTRSNVITPSRTYAYPWTNKWYTAKCDPADVRPGRAKADLEAAMANLHAMHNRMHDWSYRLGFTETAWNMQTDNGDRGGLGGDPERGQRPGGRLRGGSSVCRDNANQISGPDASPITNMYLWQPIAGSFYAPCVDGDYDMSVIGHEYSHAISGRMIGGPNAGMERRPGRCHEREHSSRPVRHGQLTSTASAAAATRPYVTGGYVTGDKKGGHPQLRHVPSPR